MSESFSPGGTRQRGRARAGAEGAGLTEVRHDVPELGGGDVAVAVLVEDLERLLDLLLAVRVAHLARHHRQELGEVDRAVAVRVDLVDHVLQLRLCGVLPQRAHHGAEFFGRDRAIAVLNGKRRVRKSRGEGGEER